MPKPKDFTESANNLCNPPEVKKLLDELSAEESTLKALQEEIAALNPDLIAKSLTQAGVVGELQAKIRGAIEEHGSYQDLENERYGVRYARRTAIYHLEPFKTNFPKFVGLCVRESIDATALKGQVKGKLLTESQLEDAGVLTYDTGYSFYVR